MPAFPNLTDQEIADIAEFLHERLEAARNRAPDRRDGLARRRRRRQEPSTSTDPAAARLVIPYRGTSPALVRNTTRPTLQGRIVNPRPGAGRGQATVLSPRATRRVTVTVPNGQTFSGTLDYVSEFAVTLIDGVRRAADVQAGRRRPEGRRLRSPSGALRHAAHVSRQGHAGLDRISVDAQMTRQLPALVLCAALGAAVAARQDPGLTPAQILKPSLDSWPTFHGDYSGPPLQHAGSDQQQQRQEPVPRVDEPAQHLAAGSDHRRQRARARAGCGPDREHQSDAAAVQRHALPGHAEQRVRPRREDRQAGVALLLEEPWRVDDRQPRAGHVGQLSIPRYARSASRVAGRGDGQGALELSRRPTTAATCTRRPRQP